MDPLATPPVAAFAMQRRVATVVATRFTGSLSSFNVFPKNKKTSDFQKAAKA